MKFNSPVFIILGFASIIIFYLINPKYRIGFLTILSCGFIANSNYYLLIYVIGYSLINYIIGIKIADSRFKISFFRTGIFINLSQLIVFKYASFTIDPIIRVFNNDISILKLDEIFLPVGISFFTLQAIGYLINVKMEWEKPERNFINFLLYISFYPKFLSGPIERSNHFLPQLKINQIFNEKQITNGFRIILFGFLKKIVIANQLGIYVNGVYSDIRPYGGSTLLCLILIQPLYLYFDFSAYTDIAIGLAKTYGINLLPNFNRPFLSENVTTFWKRFHISLSSWFNDYVFKQTSFRYRNYGKYAPAMAVFVTFILFGIWHGAGWNFMILGMLQALAINFEFFSKKKRTLIFHKMSGFLRIWSGRILTYIFFGLSLVFFFSPDIKSALDLFSRLTDFGSNTHIIIIRTVFYFTIFLALCFIFEEILVNDYVKLHNKIERFWRIDSNCHKLIRWVTYFLVVTALILFNNKTQQFIYDKF